MKQINETENIKLQMLDEMERAIMMQKANKELQGYLMDTILYVFKYAQKNNIVLPRPNLKHSMKEISRLIDQINIHKISNHKDTENSDQPQGNNNNNYRRGNSTA